MAVGGWQGISNGALVRRPEGREKQIRDTHLKATTALYRSDLVCRQDVAPLNTDTIRGQCAQPV